MKIIEYKPCRGLDIYNYSYFVFMHLPVQILDSVGLFVHCAKNNYVNNNSRLKRITNDRHN